jgi:predicted metalloprotease
MSFRIRALVKVRAVAAAAALVSVVSCRETTPPPGTIQSEPGDAVQPAPNDAAAIRQLPTDRWPRREVDWSTLKKNPLSTPLGRWDEYVAADKVCLDGSNPQRCVLMLRALERVGSASEIRDTMQQVNMAMPVLQSVWAEEFKRIGRTFVVPSVSYYGIDWQGVDGVLPADQVNRLGGCQQPFENAVYCPQTHSIYFDAIFLARVGAAVREIDGTSGRYAALAVAAHELGHAVHMQTGDGHGDRPRQELLADCFSGAAMAALRRAETGVGYSKASRLLYTQNALTEGQLGIALIQGPVAKGPYQAGPIRADFFTGGFNRGFGSCAERFKNPLA